MSEPGKLRVALGMARIVAGMALLGALMGWIAGRFAWPALWAFVTLTALGLVALALGLVRANPALFAERQATPFKGKDQPLWDKLAIALIFVTMGLWLILPGLELGRMARPALPVWLALPGALAVIAALRVMYLSLIHNPNLIQTVELRDGARLATTGPYAHVRHPYYAGFSLFYLGGALMLGSLAALLWTGAIAAVFAWRLIREERLLRAELAGYESYCSAVRYRLVPGLW